MYGTTNKEAFYYLQQEESYEKGNKSTFWRLIKSLFFNVFTTHILQQKLASLTDQDYWNVTFELSNMTRWTSYQWLTL